jgi:high-affinity iron transporter
VGDLLALSGALAGIVAAIGIGYALYRGAVRVDLGRFFTWSGAFLIIVSAGILAYGIHDLQEAAVLPGPFSGEPISPTHPRTGDVLVGLTGFPFWGAAYPFGWAFDVEDVIAPSGFIGALLKGTVGFVPKMSWMEVTAWAVYLMAVVPPFIRHSRRMRRPQRRAEHHTPSASAALPEPGTAPAARASSLPPEGTP